MENKDNKELATIKKVGNATEAISKEEYEYRIKEIAKCKRDIVYFAENYFRIINLDRGLEIIKLFDIQKELLNFLVQNNKIICCSGRQQGKSTIYCIYTLWLTCFFPEKKVMILANKSATALELLGRIEMGYSYLPSWLKPSVISYNKGEMMFANKSGVRGFASSSDAARGFSANVVICDEFAFLQNNLADKLFTSMFPVISSSKNGKFILVSTPNGTGNLFYEIWQQANSKDPSKNENGWKPFTMWWWQVPGHDEKWKENQIAAIGKERFAQEFNNEFLAGSSFRKLIPDEVIEKYRQRISEYKLKKEFPCKDLQITIESVKKAFEFKMWFEYQQGHNYVCAGDVAEGTGGDYSVLYVFDITHLDKIKLCAKFSDNHILPTEFAYVTNKILSLYGNPYYICESNGVGSAYLDVLHVTYGYQNIVHEGKDNGIGVRSHVQIKGRAVLWLQEMFTTVGIDWVIPDIELIDEMTTFIQKNTKAFISYAAIPGAHDDLIMTLCWAAWMMNPDIIEKYSIVVETFKTTFDKILPKTTQPIFEYTQNQLNEIYSDPLYQKFIDFKNESMQKFEEAKKIETILEKTSKEFDPFTAGKMLEKTISELREERQKTSDKNNYSRQFIDNVLPTFYVNGDAGFGDDDFDGPSWN